MGRVVHFEITADDVARARKFYEIFGWVITDSGMPGTEYWLAKTGEGGLGIDGAIMPRSYSSQPAIHWLGVDDLDATMEKVVAAGGSITGEKQTVPGVGDTVHAKDTEGNTFGLIQPLPRGDGAVVMSDREVDMDAKQLFKVGLAQASEVVRRIVPSSDLGLPTPCTEWDVRMLVAHMLFEVSWVPDIVAGATVDEVGGKYDGDLLGADLSGSWHDAAETALLAVGRCDPGATAHLSYADVTNEAYLREVGGEQLIHAWDLGEALGIPVRYEPVVARAVLEDALPKAESWRASGLFAPPVEVPESADLQTRLLGLFGRSTAWRDRR